MTQSEQLFDEALQYIPGGVNSPVRAFGAVGGTPVFIERANKAYLTDVDGKQYIDYVGSWGPMILGHNNPLIAQAVNQAIAGGLSFGAPTAGEARLAKLITELMPNLEMVRLVNSGTEAVMTAIRLARGATKRPKIIKFASCYHGHADSLLVQAGSGALTCGVPSSAGIPEEFTQHTLVAQFNDLDSVKQLLAQYRTQVAAIIVEPIAGNMGCVPPVDEFLSGLRTLCNQYGCLLIFDEVMTGFRVALGGAQALYQITPDLTTLGKIIGGGLPVGALGGRKNIMQQLAPLGPVYQAGTLSGNPIAVAAGYAALQQLQQPEFYIRLHRATYLLVQEIEQRAKTIGIAVQCKYVTGMFSLFFNEQPAATYARFFHELLRLGVYFPPSPYEACFVSSCHDDAVIADSVAAIGQALERAHNHQNHNAN